MRAPKKSGASALVPVPKAYSLRSLSRVLLAVGDTVRSRPCKGYARPIDCHVRGSHPPGTWRKTLAGCVPRQTSREAVGAQGSGCWYGEAR